MVKKGQQKNFSGARKKPPCRTPEMHFSRRRDAEFPENPHRSVASGGAVCSPRFAGIYLVTAPKKRADFRKK